MNDPGPGSAMSPRAVSTPASKSSPSVSGRPATATTPPDDLGENRALLVQCPAAVVALELDGSQEIVARATHASYTPDGRGLVYARARDTEHGTTHQLMYRPDLASVEERALGPALQADIDAAWRWRLSPDGRRICVLRSIPARYYWPHGLHRPEQGIPWAGIIDLESGDDTPIPALVPPPTHSMVNAKLYGWQGEQCIVSPGSYELAVAVDGESGSLGPPVTRSRGVLLAVSDDARSAVLFDGGDGDVAIRLVPLGDARPADFSRELLSDPFIGREARGGQCHADARFEPGGRRLVVWRSRTSSMGVSSRLALEDIGSGQVSYEANVAGSVVTVIWAPDGSSFASFERNAVGQWSIRHVECDGEPSERITELSETPSVRPFPPLFSPDSAFLVWVDDTQGVHALELETHYEWILGALPSDAASWTWTDRATHAPPDWSRVD